ncbi:hypothetical protein [Microcoleus sp. N3A4]|uniref:hypothetical protein n=1 Tax=Microcoleus sp. N3A4 TaxID=3055379 RepID=UPI002FCF06D3
MSGAVYLMCRSSNKSHIGRLKNLPIRQDIYTGDRQTACINPPAQVGKPSPEAKFDRTSTTAEDFVSTP